MAGGVTAQGLQAGAAIVAEITQDYPAFAPFFEIPEVRDKLIQAIINNWTPTKTASEIYKTEWWRTTPESVRTWKALEAVDPAEATRQRHERVLEMGTLAQQEGVSLTLPQLAMLAEASLSKGWSDMQIRQQIVGAARMDDAQVGGIDSTIADLRQTAADYGIKVSDATLFDWGQRVRAGRTSLDAFTEYARNQAKVHYGALAPDIDRGVTVRQWAEPYVQEAVELLGVNPADIDIRDSRWSRALRSHTDKGLVPMDMATWRRTLMADPIYGYDRSEHAVTAANQLRDALGRDFGVLA